MKRLFLILAVALLLPAFVFAAGETITVSEGQFSNYTGRVFRVITISVVFGDGAEDPSGAALNDLLTATGSKLQPFGEWWLLSIDSVFGSTPVTASSDLYVYRTADKKIDILGGNGVDKIDDNTNLIVYPATSSQPLTGAEVIDFVNNAAVDSLHTLRLYLYKD